MARGRIISRSLGGSKKFKRLVPTDADLAVNLGEFAQVLYVLIVANTDDFGLYKADGDSLKLNVFPGSRRSEEQFEAAVRLLKEVGLLRLYEADGEAYLEVLNFEQHQTLRQDRRRAEYPLPPTCHVPPANVRSCPPEGEGEVEVEAKAKSNGLVPGDGTTHGKPRVVNLCDNDYLAELQSREAYHDLNVRYVYSKMVSWCEVRSKIPTRARLLNWLNREDRPMTAKVKSNGDGKQGYSQRQSAAIDNALAAVGLNFDQGPDHHRDVSGVQRSLPVASARGKRTNGHEE